MMKLNGRLLHTAFIQWIRSEFQKGLVLTADVRRFMESAFGTLDIEAVLKTAHDSETGPLLELLCFPDRGLRLRFESHWGDRTFTMGDQSAVIALLSGSPLNTVVKSTSGASLVSIEIPPFVLEAAVRRLRITWQPPPSLVRSLARLNPPEHRLVIRVFLRQARLPWYPEQLRLMELFLGKMPAESDGFEACLAFLISIMAELMPGCRIHDFLVEKKMFYFKALCRAENFERRRRSSNMEILMLQGARAAHGDVDTWQHGMQMIDTLCLTLFKRTRYFQRPGEERLNIERSPMQQQIEDVVGKLS
jgi:hypothetical protein